MNKTQAMKKLREIMASEDPSIVFIGHAIREMMNDFLSEVDVLNVLKSKSAGIKDEPEFKDETMRYRVMTSNYCVVVTFFKNADGVTVVTVWKISRK